MTVQGFSLHIFHAVEDASVGERAGIVYWNNTGVFEAGQDFSFAQKTSGKVAAFVDSIENLERDLSI
jgi:hypothetical protein